LRLQRWTAAAAAAAAAVASSAVAARAGECPDPSGREEAVIQGQVLIALTEFPGSDAKEGCVVGYIPASPAAVMTILRDAASYDEYMPRVERSDVSTGSGGVILNQQNIELPRVRHKKGDPAARILFQRKYPICYSLFGEWARQLAHSGGRLGAIRGHRRR